MVSAQARLDPAEPPESAIRVEFIGGKSARELSRIFLRPPLEKIAVVD